MMIVSRLWWPDLSKENKMTLTTQVRINYPVPAEQLLDHVTRVAGGDPATVARRCHAPGDAYEWGGGVHDEFSIWNKAGQGLRTLAGVKWSENVNEPGWPMPPALVVLSIDNPYGTALESGRSVQANEILPAVVEWLDDHGVPRTAWWWEDETGGTYHPGTEDVAKLNTSEPREEWRPSVSR